jgi:hypothetical protein
MLCGLPPYHLDNKVCWNNPGPTATEQHSSASVTALNPLHNDATVTPTATLQWNQYCHVGMLERASVMRMPVKPSMATRPFQFSALQG